MNLALPINRTASPSGMSGAPLRHDYGDKLARNLIRGISMPPSDMECARQYLNRIIEWNSLPSTRR